MAPARAAASVASCSLIWAFTMEEMSIIPPMAMHITGAMRANISATLPRRPGLDSRASIATKRDVRRRLKEGVSTASPSGLL